MLATDFMLQGAVDQLQKVLNKELRLDRTIEVSVTNKAEKIRIMARLEPNLKTLRKLLVQNKTDFATSISKSKPLKERRAAWKRLVRRRNKCVKLVEESNLRINRLQPLFTQLEEINTRMQDLTRLLAEVKSPGYRGSRSVEDVREDLHYLCLLYTSPSPRDKRQSRMPSSA